MPGRRKTPRTWRSVRTDFPQLIKFAKQNNVSLTVVGPEAPLAAGIVDAMQAAQLRVFGPSKAAAQLEGSKVFCKNLLRNADVPSADYHVFRDAESAQRFVMDRYPEKDQEVPLVVKADGLAAGKGVVVCSRREHVLAAIQRIVVDREFGDAGREIIFEERLDGQEASVLAITDGRTIVTLTPAQDHKPAYDGDEGPNTGGMGAYCPTPLVDQQMLAWIEEHVLVPTVHAMKRSRRPFSGVLYAGLMITHQGPKVLEYNVRFGDPECQPLLMRLRSDLVDVLEATVDQRLDEIAPLRMGSAPRSLRRDGRRRLSGKIRYGPADSRTRTGRRLARRQSLPCRHQTRRRQRAHQRRARAGRHRAGQLHFRRQTAGLHRRQVHSLARRLVPQRYFG